MIVYLVEGKYDETDPMLGWMIFGAYVDKDDAEYDADKLRDGRGSAKDYRVRELILHKKPVYADEDVISLPTAIRNAKFGKPQPAFSGRWKVTMHGGDEYIVRAPNKDGAEEMARTKHYQNNNMFASVFSVEEIS